jgi:hypothetical protein
LERSGSERGGEGPEHGGAQANDGTLDHGVTTA